MDGIAVAGNVYGHIITGNNNKVETHNYYGTVINQAALPTARRAVSPKPPPEPEGFVGRKRELAQVEEWIAQKKAVIVQGMDGIGKTSLIKQAANTESARSQPDGVVVIEGPDEEGKLLGFGDTVQRIFNALFESQPQIKVELDTARTYLSNTHPLVLLNSITLTPQELNQLQGLFSDVPMLIATENMILTRGRKYSLSLGPLEREDSLALLASLSSVDDREALDQIAALLENVPAALSIVADTIRVNGLTAGDVLSRLQSYTPRETNKSKAAVERAFHLIHSVLSEEERGMLDQVAAAFGVSVDRKWLESQYGGTAVAEKLESLQLLQANSPRLRLMPGLRPLLQEGRDLTKQREHLLSHLLSELETRWNDFDFIKDELGNLLGLLLWAAAQGQWANVAALGRGMDPYLALRLYWGAWRQMLDEVQRAAKAMENLALQGWVLHQLATYEAGMGNLSAAKDYLQQAISIRQKLGDEVALAYSQHNLQAIAPLVQPSGHVGNWRPWLLGGVAVAAIAAYLVFNRPSQAETPPAVTAAVTSANVVAAVSPSPTQTATDIPTQTPSPSPTISDTATFTPTHTDTPTAAPTYTTLSRIVVNDLAAYFYGPGTVYLNKGTRRIAGNTVDVLGRIETDKGIWVNTKFSLPRTDVSNPCWMDARYLDITPEQLMGVKPVDPANPQEYKLPIDRLSRGRLLADPEITGVIPADDAVTVSWRYFDVGEGEYPNHDENFYRYLIEAWLCRAGKIVFSPSGWGPYGPDVIDGAIVSARLENEPGCTEPSCARLYLAWAHGYVGPMEITPWP